MKGKKILFISSEVVPYMPQTEISTLTYNLPKLVNENGGQTRIFIPKYGNINERRHQLKNLDIAQELRTIQDILMVVSLALDHFV